MPVPRPTMMTGVSGLAGRRKLSLCSTNTRTSASSGRRSARWEEAPPLALCHLLAVAHHADGQVHLFFHLALGGGDGVEAGVRGAAVDQLIGTQGSREAFQYVHHLGAGHQGVDLGLVTGQIFERRVVRDLGEASDQAPCSRVSS